MREFSVTDGLTDLNNRRGLFQFGEHEVERPFRFDHLLSIVMFDLDHFKNINDTYGHPVGDRILTAVAACCYGQLRTVDIAARDGGDEFVLILPETDQEGAVQLAERLRASIENIALSVASEAGSPYKTVGVTASMGVVMLAPPAESLTEMLRLADLALYDAKCNGRNRVELLNYQG